MNPFDTYRLTTPLKKSFSLEDLKKENIYEEKQSDEGPYNIKKHFSDELDRSLDRFINLTLENENRVPYPFSNMIRHYQNTKDFKENHNLLIEGQVFEAELFKLIKLLLITEESTQTNQMYKSQLFDTIKSIIKMNEHFGIDNNQFISQLYIHLQNKHKNQEEIIDFVRNQFSQNSFFYNPIIHFHDNYQKINLYNPVYLLTFYDDKKSLEQHIKNTVFSNLNYLNIKNYKNEDNYFIPDISENLEKDIMEQFNNVTNSAIFQKLDVLNKAFFCRHYDFVLPNLDICLLIHFSIRENSGIKSAKDIDQIRTFYTEQGINISEEKESLLLANALHYKNAKFFKNWNWNASDNLAIKKLFTIKKMGDHNENIKEDLSLSELFFINSVEKKIISFAKTLNYEESFSLCKESLHKDFTTIKGELLKEKTDFKKLDKYLELYLKPVQIIIENSKEKDLILESLNKYILSSLSQGVRNKDVLSLIEKNLINLSICKNKTTYEPESKKRL